MGKAKQITTALFFNFRRQWNGGVIPDGKQVILSAAMTGMSGILWELNLEWSPRIRFLAYCTLDDTRKPSSEMLQ